MYKDAIVMSFTLTYILLLTTGVITFIEALATNNSSVRHVMNLETCISLVAGYFYGVFLTQIKEKIIDWSKLVLTRYIDWCVTTPMMLLTLCFVLGLQTKRPVHILEIMLIVVWNYLMLFCGYLGETKQLSRLLACTVGFIFFTIMFMQIYVLYVAPKYSLSNYILYSLYLSVWSLYGVVYFLNEVEKNISLNILDVTAKCFIGLGLWAYYTKLIVA